MSSGVPDAQVRTTSGLKRQQPLQIDPPGIADSRQLPCRRREVAVLDGADQRLPGTRCIDEFREMRREAHDAQGRDRRLSCRGGEERRQEQRAGHTPHVPASSDSKRSRARSNGQSKATPGSVLRPGATSLCPTTRSAESAG